MKHINWKTVLLATAVSTSSTYQAHSQEASPQSADMAVKLVIEDECTIAVDDLDFGTTGLIDQEIAVSTTATVTCTQGSGYNIGLSAGANAEIPNDVTTRRLAMNDGVTTHYIPYHLRVGSSTGAEWGNTRPTDTLNSEAATGDAEEITVYGVVPVAASGPHVPTGTYEDTITATIWYGSDYQASGG
jgi:spore coat protein U-like protein